MFLLDRLVVGLSGGPIAQGPVLVDSKDWNAIIVELDDGNGNGNGNGNGEEEPNLLWLWIALTAGGVAVVAARTHQVLKEERSRRK